MEKHPTYTVEDARALLPQVRAILLQIALERRRAEDSHAAAHRRASAAVGREMGPRAELDTATAELRAGVGALLDHLTSLGVVVRDLQSGLVDIPTLRDGEPAWLCWRLDDPELAWWHTTTEGFGSRRPL